MTSNERLEHIRDGLVNDYYMDVDPLPDFKFLWHQFQLLQAKLDELKFKQSGTTLEK